MQQFTPAQHVLEILFNRLHDAMFLHISMNIQDDDYIPSMRDMVTKQIDDSATIRKLLPAWGEF